MSPADRRRPLVEDLRIGLARRSPARRTRARSSGRRARATREPRRSRPYDVPAPCPIVCSLPPRLTAPSTEVRPARRAAGRRARADARARADTGRARDRDRRQRRRLRGQRPERGAGRAGRARGRGSTPASSGSTSSACASRTPTSACSTSRACATAGGGRALLARRRGGCRVLAPNRRGVRRAETDRLGRVARGRHDGFLAARTGRRRGDRADDRLAKFVDWRISRRNLARRGRDALPRPAAASSSS